MRPKKDFKKKLNKREKNYRVGGTNEEVLEADILSLLSETQTSPIDDVSQDTLENKSTIPEKFTQIEVEISKLSSTGEGIGRPVNSPSSKETYVIPFTAPGDRVIAKVISHHIVPSQTDSKADGEKSNGYIKADLVQVTSPSPHRNDRLIGCKYFGVCSGCQFQHLPYAYQLTHKRTIVERAFKNFSGLPFDLLPEVGETLPSPKQYGYRTKLTPHFDAPKGARRGWKRNAEGEKVRAVFEEVPNIGFNKRIGQPGVLDVEECPIATPVVQLGLKRERRMIKEYLDKYNKGATILLRESTERLSRLELKKDEKTVPNTDEEKAEMYEQMEGRQDTIEHKTCVSSPNATSTEYVGDLKFANPANSFFQNNNSVLPRFTSYIRENILPPEQRRETENDKSGISQSPSTNGTTETNITATPNETSTSSNVSTESKTPKIKNLIDAYSGTGLFTLTLSNLFETSIGVDIDANSISFASQNALNNNLPLTSTDTRKVTKNNNKKPDHHHPSPLPSSSPPATKIEQEEEPTIPQSPLNPPKEISFHPSDASQIFSSIYKKNLNPEETVLILDPPRKGCDVSFLRQLIAFGPERVVYVSCNVHTQAGDVGFIVYGGDGDGDGEGIRGGEEGFLNGGEKDSNKERAGNEGEQSGKRSIMYEIESIQPFDFFPQTGHVEGVVILRRNRS